VDSAGNSMVVWAQGDELSGIWSIWASRLVFDFGQPGAPTLIETTDFGQAFFPQVAIDGAGNAIAVWEQSDGATTSIWANRFVPDTGWGTATLVETDDSAEALRPRVVADAAGTATAVWHQGSQIWASRFDDETGWGPAALLGNAASFEVEPPDVVVDAEGDVTVVWHSAGQVTANRYVDGRGWGTATQVGPIASSFAQLPQAAVDPTGSVIVVWEESVPDGDNTIWENRFTPDSGWGTPAIVASGPSTSASLPEVGTGGDGSAIAVWEAEADAWVTRNDPESGWHAPFPLGTGAAPVVAVDSAGNAIALWREPGSGAYDLRSRRYFVGEGWNDATTVDAGFVLHHQIVVDPAGNMTAVYADGAEIWLASFR
jgi:hypothetical protein